jgi:hypothetical protein
VFSPNVFTARRAVVAEVLLALSVLSACSYDSSNPTYPTDPPPSPTPSAVDVAYCRGAEPLWVAFQDGDGAWMHVRPVASGQYTTFHYVFTQARGAVARAAELPGGFRTLSILYGAPSELGLVSDTAFQQCSAEAQRTVNGTVAGLGANDIALVTAGNSLRDFTSNEFGDTWQLRGALAGPQEFLATRGTVSNGVVSLTKMILRRSPALPDGATLPVFDFESAEAFRPVVRNVTFAGNDGSTVTAFTGLRTAHSNNFLTFLAGGGATTTSPSFALPEDQLAPGEIQSVGATSVPVGNVARSVVVYSRAPVDRTLTFGATPSAPELSVVSTTPTVRLRARFATQADYDRYTSINFQQDDTVLSLSMTRAYATLAGGYDLVVPDLTSAGEFDPRWTLRSGTRLLWTTARVGGAIGVDHNAMPRDGDVTRSGSDAGFVTP